MFYNFHMHSQYSYKDALPTPKMIAQKYKELGLNAFCITDHGNLNSFIDAYAVAKELDMQFIPGCEFYLQPFDENWALNKTNNKTISVDESRLVKYHHITAIAKNQNGLKSLVELYNDANEHYGKRLVTLQDILSKQGLIVLSGCVAGQAIYYILTGKTDKAQEVLEQCRGALGDDFYIELQFHNLREFGQNWGTNEVDVYNTLIELAKKLQIKMAVTNDSHYVNESDRHHHNLYKAIHLNKSFDYNENKLPQAYDGENYHILTEDEIRKSLTNYQLAPNEIDEIIVNTVEIRNKCENTEFMCGKPLSNKTEELTALIKQGWERLRKDTPYAEESEKRWQYELSVVKEKNFTEYFINVYNIVNKAKEIGLVTGPGRGSGAGSEINYLLGITSVDPLKYGLIFERFLNPSRNGYPDIDVDFQHFVPEH